MNWIVHLGSSTYSNDYVELCAIDLNNYYRVKNAISILGNIYEFLLRSKHRKFSDGFAHVSFSDCVKSTYVISI